MIFTGMRQTELPLESPEPGKKLQSRLCKGKEAHPMIMVLALLTVKENSFDFSEKFLKVEIIILRSVQWI